MKANRCGEALEGTMAGGKVAQIVVEGTRLERFKSCFFTQDEHNAMLQEEAVDSAGWAKKLHQRVQQMGQFLIKDPIFENRLSQLFASKALQETSARGYCETLNPQSAQVNLRVRTKSPFLFRLVDHSEFMNYDIVIHCREEGGRTIVTFTPSGRSIIDVAGCIVAVILLGACIVPGVVFLYFFFNALSIFDKMQAAVVQAVHEILVVVPPPLPKP